MQASRGLREYKTRMLSAPAYRYHARPRTHQPEEAVLAFIVVVIGLVVFSIILGVTLGGHGAHNNRREVFLVRLSHMNGYHPDRAPTQSEIFRDASENGWTIASRAQLVDAQRRGADWHEPGYYDLDNKGNLVAFGYPVSDPTPDSHGVGVDYNRLATEPDPDHENKVRPVLKSVSDGGPVGYIAIGIKPLPECVSPLETIAPFTRTQWSRLRKDSVIVDPTLVQRIAPPTDAETFFVSFLQMPGYNPALRPTQSQIFAFVRGQDWSLATREHLIDAYLRGARWDTFGVCNVKNGVIHNLAHITDTGAEFTNIPQTNGEPVMQSYHDYPGGIVVYGVKPPQKSVKVGHMLPFLPASHSSGGRWSQYDALWRVAV